MSEENVRIVRSALDAFNRGDLEGAFAFAAPDIAWHDQRDLPGSRVHRGHAAVLAHLREATEDMADYRIEVNATRTFGDDVLVQAITSARGRTSGAPVMRETFNVYRVKGGAITRVAIFGSEVEALEAVGVPS